MTSLLRTTLPLAVGGILHTNPCYPTRAIQSKW